MAMADIVFLIPTYNERENILRLIPAIFSEVARAGKTARVVVIDDNSPDGTADAVRTLSKTYPVSLLLREKKGDLGGAYRDGFHTILADDDWSIVFEMDADWSHNPSYIPLFLKEIDNGADVVCGSRYVKGGARVGCSLLSRLLGNGANFLASLLLALPIRDVTTGFRAYRRSVVQSIDFSALSSRGYAFQLEMAFLVCQKTKNIVEVPIIFSNRKSGKSKLNPLREVPRFLFLLFVLMKKRMERGLAQHTP